MTRPRLPIFIGYDSENFENIYSSYKEPIVKRIVFCSAAFALTFIFALIINTIEAIRPIQESAYTWLERSGALIGACAVFVEFKLKLIDDIVSQASARFKPDVYRTFGKHCRYKSYLHCTALFYGIIGALILSYGSPLLVLVKNIYSSFGS
jgi:flagellar biosynthesis protein FliQ